MIIKLSDKAFDSKKMDLVAEDKFIQIVDFLWQQSDKVTLRDIKRAFPEIEITDNYIEELVSYGFITRHHGKYTLGIPVITANKQQQINEVCVAYLDEHLSDIHSRIGTSSNIYFDLFVGVKNQEDVLYEETDFSINWLSQPSRITRTEAKQVTFLSLAFFYPYYSHNIADYFNYLNRKSEHLPEAFLRLRRKLGDINPNYFVPYCERKLRRLEKGKTISSEKEDIFMDALIDMGYVTVEANNCLFHMVILDTTDRTSDIQLVLEELADIVTKEFGEFPDMSYVLASVLMTWLQKNNVIKECQYVHGVLR